MHISDIYINIYMTAWLYIQKQTYYTTKSLQQLSFF